jgi:hypothetical protein
MNPRILSLKERVRAGEHKRFRQTAPVSLLAECEAENLSWPWRMTRLTRRQCEAERVVIEADERIVFTRTLPAAIPPFTQTKNGPTWRPGARCAGGGRSATCAPIGSCPFPRGWLDARRRLWPRARH